MKEDDDMITISNDEFLLLTNYIKENCGISLKDEKKALLVARLGKILNDNGFHSFMQYYKCLKEDTEGKELSRLVDKITTNHTYFMREAQHFTYFSDTVLPNLKDVVKNRDLRVWCAASSSGEEPYSLAMLMEDFFRNDGIEWNKKLLATDLSSSILETAKKGVYTKDAVNKLPKVWVLNYFDKIEEDKYMIKPEIKEEVIYRRFNLLEPVFPFRKKFHVIFCRNVMIYFDNETRDDLINKFYDALEPGGYLFMGHSESVNREKSKFKIMCPAVYRKL